MKKRLALAFIGWLCGGAFAQTNPAPANSTPAAQPAPQTAPVTTGAVESRNGVAGNRNNAYTDRIQPEQIITLDASGDKFQARYIADLSGQPRGAVIVLHDSGQHPTWPFTAAALIDDLPLHGWGTLNIDLPPPSITEPATPETAAATAAPSATTPPTATTPTPASGSNNATAAAPASNTTPAIAGVEPQTQARINAAIKYFSDQNQRNIVLIGFGSGAIRAAENLRLIAATNPPASTNPAAPTASLIATAPLTALVMIAPLQRLNGIDMDLPKLLPLTGISTLDMVLDNDVQARAEAEARRRAVLHQRARTYTRVELPPLNTTSDAQHSVMVKRVRSWLHVNANTVEKPTETPSQNTAPR